MKYFPQEDEWQINETYMDNISKYPKDWYKQLTRRSKKKPLEEEVGEKSKSDKRRSSNQQVKPAKDKQEEENGDGAEVNKSDEDKEAIAEKDA